MAQIKTCKLSNEEMYIAPPFGNMQCYCQKHNRESQHTDSTRAIAPPWRPELWTKEALYFFEKLTTALTAYKVMPQLLLKLFCP